MEIKHYTRYIGYTRYSHYIGYSTLHSLQDTTNFIRLVLRHCYKEIKDLGVICAKSCSAKPFVYTKELKKERTKERKRKSVHF